jgi:hypothetical protein
MGIFGKKKEDELESNGDHSEPSSKPPEPQPEAPKKKDGPYGIDQLVHLMRRLPTDNIELVVKVLKETLESVKIAVPELIKGAEKRELELTNNITEHKKSIASLEEELAAKKKQIEESIAAKKKAIAELEAAHKEVMVVKDRLTLGLKLDQVTVAPVVPQPPPMAKATPPPPPPPEN